MLFRLNEYYNRHFEQRIAASIFAAGGTSAISTRRRMRKWLSAARGIVLDVGCGDRKAERYLPDGCRYVGIDHFEYTQVSPWRTALPHVNADALKLPLAGSSVDWVLNMSVIEHVTDPARLVAEMARVLRPGGTLALVGPGDIRLSHGEPYIYFNLTRYAYQMLLERNGLEIVDEHFPAKFWTSMALLLYAYFVRNDFYNRHPLLKLLQIPVFALSLVLSPPINLVVFVLDALLPFDRRGYGDYMLLARKKR